MAHTCRNCGGSGKATCPRCGGDGKIQGETCLLPRKRNCRMQGMRWFRQDRRLKKT